MALCESQGIDYVFGLQAMLALMRMSLDTQEKAKVEYQQLKESVTALWYKTPDSWSHFRRWSQGGLWTRGLQLRFVVTSLPARRVPPSQLYTQHYCPRGEMENRFRSSNSNLFSARTHTFQGNQLWLWFSIAYVLVNALQNCLATTELACTSGTIRTKLLKLGARVHQCSAHSDCYQHWLSLPNVFATAL